MKIYGIPNCNTVKKAQDWLKANDLAYTFHNFKKDGITPDKLNQWCDFFGWENVLNKKGTTWRKLSADEQAAVVDQPAAVKVMMANPSAIKRPVVEKAEQPVCIGFNEAQYQSLL